MRSPEPGEDRLDRHDLSFRRCVDLLPVTDVDTNMRHPVMRIGVGMREENQVARLKLVARYARGGVVLLLRGARQQYSQLAKHQLDQARAVQANRRVRPAEDVRYPQ